VRERTRQAQSAAHAHQGLALIHSNQGSCRFRRDKHENTYPKDFAVASEAPPGSNGAFSFVAGGTCRHSDDQAVINTVSR